MFVELVLTLLVLLTIWNFVRKPSQYPPGPWGLPLIGYFPLGMKRFQEKLNELHKEYYPIFSWRIGSRLFVVISDYKLIKEAFQSQTFADRPPISFVTFFEEQYDAGVLASNGIHWQNIRRFTLRHLRDLGMGKSKIVSAVQREANELVKVMKKQAGTVAPIPREISTAIINILWQMVAGKRYDLDDAEIISLDNDMHDYQNNFGNLMIRDLFPWLQSVVPNSVMNSITKRNVHAKLTENLTNRFEKDVDEHLKVLDHNNPRDYIDEYLIEMEKQKGDSDSTMSRRDLVGCIGDLFGAGMETTSITLHWSLFHLAKYQQIQKELHKEIDNVLPNEISPTFEDRTRLPKMDSFITEILRVSSLADYGVPRTVTSDTKFGGYVIPKGSIVFAAQKKIHFDNKYYDSPDQFNPQRFIDSDGKFENPKEGLLPFGIGKRQCIGENFARMELFIFLVTMLQHLEFHVPPNKDISLEPEVIPLFRKPHLSQDILIKTRS